MSKFIFTLATLLLLAACNGNDTTKSGDDQQADSSVKITPIPGLADSVQKYPDSPGYRFRFAEQLAQQGDFRSALRENGVLLQQDSTNAALLYQRGLLLLGDGDTARGIVSLQHALRSAPLFVQPRLELASIYAGRNDAKALREADEIINNAQDPASRTRAYFVKGLYYSNTNDIRRAMEAFDDCIRNDYTFMDAYIEKGLLLYDQKKYQEAIDLYEKAIAVSNRFAEAYFQRGRAYEAMGRREEAIDSYQRTIALDKDFGEARQRLDALR